MIFRDKIRNGVFSGMLVGVLSLGAGCGEYLSRSLGFIAVGEFLRPFSNNCPVNSCPSCEDTLYTRGNYALSGGDIGIGQHRLGIFARECFDEGDCGQDYSVKKGSGVSFEVFGCNDSVHMDWDGGVLRRVSVREGWQGSTDTGLRIGDSLEKFLGEYWNAEKRRVYSAFPISQKNVWTVGNLKVNFDDDERLNFLEIGERDHDFFDPMSNSVDPIGPDEWIR